MSNRTVTAENFAEVVQDLLEEYQGNIEDNLEEIQIELGKKGVRAIKNTANSLFKPCKKLTKGRYGQGWTYKVDRQRLYAMVTIYNKSYPGLPHLLEHGHATVNGGRTRAFVHIYPVEKSIKQAFENKIKVTIQMTEV